MTEQRYILRFMGNEVAILPLIGDSRGLGMTKNDAIKAALETNAESVVIRDPDTKTYEPVPREATTP